MSFVSTPSFLLAEGVQVALPGGTGTAARSAALVAQGRLSLGERFVHKSITGGLRA